MVGRGVVTGRFVEDLQGSFAGVDFGGGFLESLLILMKIRISDFEKFIERRIDHFFVKQFLGIEIRAQAEIAG